MAAGKVEDFSNEVKFSVGQRVRVQLSEVEASHVQCDTGIIREIAARFFATPKLRTIRYTVRFDKGYIKPKKIMGLQINEIQVGADKISKI